MYVENSNVVMDSEPSPAGGAPAPATPAPTPPIAAPEPTSTPAPAAPASEFLDDKPAGGDNDAGSNVFSDIAAEDVGPKDEGGEPAAPAPKPTPSPTPPPAAPVAAAAQPAAPAAAATPQPAQPGAQPAPVQPSATPSPPAAATTPQPTEEERRAKLLEARGKAVEQLETTTYAIKEDDVAKLISEPEKVIPRLLANAHANVLDHVQQAMQQMLPAMIQQVQQAQEYSTKAANAFFKEWPELDKPEFRPIVARVLAGYRAANPQAKTEDVIREGGISALVALRQPMPQRVLVAHNAGQPDATRPGAFSATPMSSAPSGAPAGPSDNPFTVIAQEDLTSGDYAR